MLLSAIRRLSHEEGRPPGGVVMYAYLSRTDQSYSPRIPSDAFATQSVPNRITSSFALALGTLAIPEPNPMSYDGFNLRPFRWRTLSVNVDVKRTNIDEHKPNPFAPKSKRRPFTP